MTLECMWLPTWTPGLDSGVKTFDSGVWTPDSTESKLGRSQNLTPDSDSDSDSSCYVERSCSDKGGRARWKMSKILEIKPPIEEREP